MEKKRLVIYNIIKNESNTKDLIEARDQLRVSKWCPITIRTLFYPITNIKEVVILMLLRCNDCPENLFMKIFLPGELKIYGDYGKCFVDIDKHLMFHAKYKILDSQDKLNCTYVVNRKITLPIRDNTSEMLESCKEEYMRVDFTLAS